MSFPFRVKVFSISCKGGLANSGFHQPMFTCESLFPSPLWNAFAGHPLPGGRVFSQQHDYAIPLPSGFHWWAVGHQQHWSSPSMETVCLLLPFKIFSCGLHQSDSDVTVFTYHAWGSRTFLGMHINLFHQIWKVFSHYFQKHCCAPSLLSPETAITWMLSH